MVKKVQESSKRYVDKKSFSRLTFTGIPGNFLIFQSLRPKKGIPAKKTFTATLLYRLSSKFSWTEKKIVFFTGRFVNFAQGDLK